MRALHPAREKEEPPRSAPVRSRARHFNPAAAVERVMDTVRNLDAVPPRLVVVLDSSAPLPPVVLGDEDALVAALLNVALSALRSSVWTENVPVRLRIAAQLRVRGPPHAPGAVTLSVRTQQRYAESEESEPEASLPAGTDVLLNAVAEAPGRPLTPLEISELMAPFGLFPSDKGGATGLPMQVARALARANGGDLDIFPLGNDATAMALSFGLLVPEHGDPLDVGTPPAKVRGTIDVPPANWSDALPPPDAALPPVILQEVPPAALMTSALFEHLLENCDDIFAVCSVSPALPAAATGGVPPDLDVRLVYASPSLGRRLGVEPATAVGCSISELCHPDDCVAFTAELTRARSSLDGQLYCTHRSRGADGSTLWCRTVGVFRDDSLYLVCRDVRPTKTAELALRLFTLTASSELREPCNTIVVALAVLTHRPCLAGEPSSGEPPSAAASVALLGADAAKEVHELLNAMTASAQLLQGIIGNVTTVPQLEEGRLAPQLSVFSPSELVDNVLCVCRLAASGGVLLMSPSATVVVLPDLPSGLSPLPLLVEADRDRLAQVLQNLVTNGIKFSNGKPVELRAGITSDAATLVFIVADHGRGMTVEEAAACFRAGAAAAPALGGGTGLGLTISSMFAALMSGTLTVDSKPRLGSTFTLRIPVHVPASGDAAAALSVEAATARTVSDAASAMAAQEEAHSLAAASAAADMKAAAGASSTQKTAVAHALQQQPQSAAASVPVVPHRLRILIADDLPLNLNLVSRLLRLHGFEVTAVADGGAALAALQAAFTPPAAGASPAASFDLWCVPQRPALPPRSACCDATSLTRTIAWPTQSSLLDMDMPVLTGPAAAAAFRAWERDTLPPSQPRLPIIALTANVAAEHAEVCTDAGMNLFLAKPLRATDVPLLRAHAAAHAEACTVAAEAAGAMPASQRAAEGAAAAACSASAIFGTSALAAAIARASGSPPP